MKNIIAGLLVGLVSVASYANPMEELKGQLYEFPRNIECFNSKDLGAVLGGKYKEKVLLSGTSMNVAPGMSKPNFIVTYSKKTGGYTIVLEYPLEELSCVIDAGEAQFNYESVFDKTHKM